MLKIKINKEGYRFSKNLNLIKKKKEKMGKKKKWSKKKKIIVGIVILIIAFIGFKMLKPKDVEVPMIETEAIQKRNIAQSISATGIIKTSDTKTVTGKLTGKEIKTVNVKEGQKIAIGDVICTFDTSDLQENLATAQTSKNLTNAQSNLGVQGAQRNLDDATKARDEQLSQMQKTVDGANSNLNSAKTNLEQVTSELNNLNSKLEKLKVDRKNIEDKIAELNKPVVPPVTNSVSGIDTTSNTVVEEPPLTSGGSLAELQAQLGKIEIEITSTNNKIAQTKTQITNLQNSVNAAQGVVNQATDALNSTRDKLNSQIAALQDQVTSSQISTSLGDTNSQTQVKAIQDQIKEGVIKSTVNGTVTQVNVKAGDFYTGSPIAVIEGCEEFIVEAQIDEYDIPDIEVGMKVLIKTDATRDEELEGRVIFASPTATSSSATPGMTATTGTTSATYTVKIALDSQNDRLRLGMNAKLSIITNSRENVWSVPYDAVYDREDGTQYIEVLKNAETEEKQEITVKKGLEGTYYVEIISNDLKEGMQVVLPKIEAGDSLEELIQMMGPSAGL